MFLSFSAFVAFFLFFRFLRRFNMPFGYSLSFNVLETKLFTLLLGEWYLAHGDIFCSLLGSQLNREHEAV